jgi:soluble lytic murein transglycosylase-like protein
MKKISVLLLALLFLTLQVQAEIIVKQDKEGNLTITNDYTKSYKKSKSKKRSAKGVTFVNSVNSKVPTKYLLKIRRLAKKYGVKESLVIAVARAESAFNPFAVSRKGAVGLMQLMEITAKQYGVVNRYNAEQNLDAGIRHLKYLNKKYNNNLPLVLAAYNAGEEAVKRYKGVPPYKETKNYIKIVMRHMGMSYASGYFATKTSTKIYQYRTKDGRTMITDSFPVNAVKGTITVIE